MTTQAVADSRATSPEALLAALDATKAMTDPVEKVKAAQALNSTAARSAKAARALRDNAVVAARMDYGVEPVVLYRDVLGNSRGLYNRMMQRANRKSPLTAIRKVAKGIEINGVQNMPIRSGEALCAVAKWATKAAGTYVRVAVEARDVRDEIGRALMDGECDGYPAMPNADFARLTGLTTARAAQIRYGTSGHSPTALTPS